MPNFFLLLAKFLCKLFYRLLVFSPFPIIKVKLKIDKGEWKDCFHVNESFYVAPWNQNEYQNGLHTITVCKLGIKKFFPKNFMNKLNFFIDFIGRS